MANAVLDGLDGILLGAETLRGKYPLETVRTVLSICKQAELVFDHIHHFEFLMNEALEVGVVGRAEGCQGFVCLCLREGGRWSRGVASKRVSMASLLPWGGAASQLGKESVGGGEGGACGAAASAVMGAPRKTGLSRVGSLSSRGLLHWFRSAVGLEAATSQTMPSVQN